MEESTGEDSRYARLGNLMCAFLEFTIFGGRDSAYQNHPRSFSNSWHEGDHYKEGIWSTHIAFNSALVILIDDCELKFIEGSLMMSSEFKNHCYKGGTLCRSSNSQPRQLLG